MTIMLRMLLLMFTFMIYDTKQTWAEVQVKELANQVSEGLGTVSRTYSGRKGVVIVFEERHSSIPVQIEIAHMLLRLHKTYGLTRVGLEGAFAQDGRLHPKWVENLIGGTKLEVMAQQLASGEISSAEFIAAAVPEVVVIGIDNRATYAVKLLKNDSSAGLFYLIAIAETKANNKTIDQFKNLAKQGELKGAVNLIFGADPWAKQKYDEMNRADRIASSEQMQRFLREIEQESKTRNANIGADLMDSMHRLQRFFEAVSQRSDTMVEEASSLAAQTPGLPISIIIGGAHKNRVVAALHRAGHSVAVITPLALTNEQGSVNLSEAAYERKEEGKSVDDKDGLGALLDGRTSKKPIPVLDSTWFQSKAELNFATVDLVRAIGSGSVPPFDTLSHLNKLNNVKIDMPTIEIKGDEVVFRAQVVDTKGEWTPIWIRAGRCISSCGIKDSIQQRIDALLKELDPPHDAKIRNDRKVIAEAGGGDGGKIPNDSNRATVEGAGDKRKKDDGKSPTRDKENIDRGSKPAAKRIGSDILAIFAKEPEGVINSVHSS